MSAAKWARAHALQTHQNLVDCHPWSPTLCSGRRSCQDFLRDHKAAANQTHVNILAELLMSAAQWAQAHALILEETADGSQLPIDLQVCDMHTDQLREGLPCHE